MISHSDRSDPAVTPPLTIAQRKISFAPQPAGLVDPFVDVLPGAEHEQQVSRPQRRLDQMPRIDRGNLGLCR